VSVPIGDAQATFAATLVDEWIRAGVTHAVVCPGSRSTPLVLALAERDEIELHVRLDERGACFYAIGLSLATATPTVVCTTSGTAAAELHAGVVEAGHAGVPLIVCTADRPPRLHHVGAPQTIEQANLFGAAVRWFFEPGVANGADSDWWRSLGARAVMEATVGPGPVHLNLAFDEPLLGTASPLPTPRAGGGPWHVALASDSTPAGTDSVTRGWAERGVIVAGSGAPSPGYLLAAADRLGWPVLADPRSGARVAHPAVVGAADGVLREPSVRDALSPETILLFGRPLASRVVSEFVESCARGGAEIISIGEEASIDPARVVHTINRVDATLFAGWLGSIPGSASPEWRGRWERVEAAAQGAIDKALANDPLTAGGRTTEPGTLRHLYATLEDTTIVFVSSSMPVRDLEWYGAPRANPPRVLSNRGANGIDGVTSSALGVAAGQDGPVVAVLGDLAFLHDASALVVMGEATHGSCTLVVLDNGGGGIFSFLPHAETIANERFERLFATVPRVSVGEVARGFGLPVADVSTLGALDEAVGRFVGHEPCSVIRVEVPSRRDNVGLHERIHLAVGHATRAALAG
jgi:2-succinyl-5-enolpyruvyl-6-hydroxy-3-cyclohexene-1-carboxylate synthase